MILICSCAAQVRSPPIEPPLPVPLEHLGSNIEPVKYSPPPGALELDVRHGELLEDCYTADEGAGAEQLPDDECRLHLVGPGLFFPAPIDTWLARSFAPDCVQRTRFMAVELQRREEVGGNAIDALRTQRDLALEQLDLVDDGWGLYEALLLAGAGTGIGVVVGVLLGLLLAPDVEVIR